MCWRASTITRPGASPSCCPGTGNGCNSSPNEPPPNPRSDPAHAINWRFRGLRRTRTHRLGQPLLQPTFLVLRRPQSLGLRHFEPTVLGLPVVKRPAADPVLAAQISRRRSCLVLPQEPDDLLFRKSTLLHIPSHRRRILSQTGGTFGA